MSGEFWLGFGAVVTALATLLAGFWNSRASSTGTLAQIVTTLSAENRRLNELVISLQLQLAKCLEKE